MLMGLELFWGAVRPTMAGAPLRGHAYPLRQQREFFWTTPEAWGTLALLDHGKLDPSPTIRQRSDVQRQAAMLYQTTGPVAVNLRDFRPMGA